MQNVEKINALEDAYEKLSNEQLRAKSDDFRKKLRFAVSFFFLMYSFVFFCFFGLFLVYFDICNDDIDDDHDIINNNPNDHNCNF